MGKTIPVLTACAGSTQLKTDLSVASLFNDGLGGTAHRIILIGRQCLRMASRIRTTNRPTSIQ